MGEFATINGMGEGTYKIGTCENMYYLRMQDMNKVNYDFSKGSYYFRLPFPDEDNKQITNYDDFNRSLYCGYFFIDSLAEDVGIIQLTDERCGLLLNLPCYHGVKLPDFGNSEHIKAFWNGKRNPVELSSIKYEYGKIPKPVFTCKCCKKSWSFDWAEVIANKDIFLPDWIKSRFKDDIKNSIKEAGK